MTANDVAELVAYLTPAELVELDAILSPPIWSALPGPQENALASAADITGYGGAAGPLMSRLERMAEEVARIETLVRRQAAGLNSRP